RSNWPGARREGGSVSAAILDRLSNEAPANFSATRRAACLLGGGVVARSSQLYFGICSGARAEALRAWPLAQIHCREAAHASILRMISPWTSVSRKSRP